MNVQIGFIYVNPLVSHCTDLCHFRTNSPQSTILGNIPIWREGLYIKEGAAMRQWFSFYDVYPVPLVHNSCEGHILTMVDSVRETMCPFFTPYHPPREFDKSCTEYNLELKRPQHHIKSYGRYKMTLGIFSPKLHFLKSQERQFAN